MSDTGVVPEGQVASRLARRLGLRDAVVVGLGAMLGAGVFSAFAPAARAAGPGLLAALGVAGLVAFCNATSSARLAAAHPQSGGAYAYGRARLGEWWGFAAGWAFVAGKLASLAAMALTFGAYVAPGAARPVGVAAVVLVTSVNLLGVTKTVALTRVLVAAVLAALALVIAGCLGGGALDAGRLTPLWPPGGVYALLQAAALLFFAFAGYARIATLGEEVVDPARTIPRAVPLALGAVLALYALVGASALAAAGAPVLAGARDPLAAAVRAGALDGLAPAVRAGAAVAALGVLLSLVAGVSRTAFAMAAAGDLPRMLGRVHPRTRVPHVAEASAGAAVAAAVALADLRFAIGFSSFAVLVYYAIANAAALRLRRDERRTRAVSALGLAGCAALAATVPWPSLATGAGVLAAGLSARAVRPARR